MMIHSILENNTVYRFFRACTGSNRINRIFAQEYVQSNENMDILDIGCGPADIVQQLKFNSYLGLDNNSRYIKSASDRYPKARFLLDSIENLGEEVGKFDRVLALGVLHHIPDPMVLDVLMKTKRLLKPGGIFVSYDPCFQEGQHVFARFIHSIDRGKHVRLASDLVALAQQIFPRLDWSVRHDLCFVPSSVVILRCQFEP